MLYNGYYEGLPDGVNVQGIINGLTDGPSTVIIVSLIISSATIGAVTQDYLCQPAVGG